MLYIFEALIEVIQSWKSARISLIKMATSNWRWVFSNRSRLILGTKKRKETRNKYPITVIHKLKPSERNERPIAHNLRSSDTGRVHVRLTAWKVSYPEPWGCTSLFILLLLIMEKICLKRSALHCDWINIRLDRSLVSEEPFPRFSVPATRIRRTCRTFTTRM